MLICNRSFFFANLLRLVVLVLILMPIHIIMTIPVAWAQGQCETALEEAEEAYDLNHFTEVIALLKPCLPGGFPDTIRQTYAYKLLALAYAAEKNDEEARAAVTKLLDLNPGYEPDSNQDQELFRIVNEIKQRRLHEEILSGKSGIGKWRWIGVGSLVVAGVTTAYLVFNREEERSLPRLPDPPTLP